MKKYLAVALKNAILKKEPTYTVKLKNKAINGEKVGCSGFIVGNGITVYVDTEKSCYEPISKLNLVRYAKDCNDNSGYYNHFKEDGDLADEVISMLNDRNRFLEEVSTYVRLH